MTVLGAKRTTPRKGLKRKTPLKRTSKLKPQSKRAKEELKIWLGVKKERIERIREKFGYLICEYCLKPIREGDEIDGHHNNHRRRENDFGNCRITHAYCNRILIEDNNIKNVPSLL